MNQEIVARILLEQPVINVDYALQKGSGHHYEVFQKQRALGADLVFECPVKVKEDKHGNPDFLGPFVQGPVGERFIYIGIGTYAGEKNAAWERRLKIPLRGIDWNMIHAVINDAGSLLSTQVPGTGKDGTPNCATVKPFNGWEVSSK